MDAHSPGKGAGAPTHLMGGGAGALGANSGPFSGAATGQAPAPEAMRMDPPGRAWEPDSADFSSSGSDSDSDSFGSRPASPRPSESRSPHCASATVESESFWAQQADRQARFL